MASSHSPAVFSVAQALSRVRERREQAAEEEARRKLEEEKLRLDRAREKRRRRRRNQKERKAQLKSAGEAADATKSGDDSEAPQIKPDILEAVNNLSPRPAEHKSETESGNEVTKLSEPSTRLTKLDELPPSRSIHKGLIPRALLVKMNKKT